LNSRHSFLLRNNKTERERRKTSGNESEKRIIKQKGAMARYFFKVNKQKTLEEN
jgi:hypothetical protein